MTEIAITGMGVVTGHGLGVGPFLSALWEGRTAIRAVDRFDTHGLCSSLAAQAPNDETLVDAARTLGEPPAADRSSRLLLAAAAEAFQGRTFAPSDRRAVIIGTTKGALDLQVEAWKVPGALVPDAMAIPANRLAAAAGARGPAYTVCVACASSTGAIGEAMALLRNDEADEVVVGGTEALHALVFAGFHALKAMAPQPAAPFDANRRGLSLGEAGGILILEPTHRAREQGRRPLAVLEGYGAASDAHDQTAPSPSARGLTDAIRRALRDAKVLPADIDLYHAHGTGTLQNDAMEARALAEVFGPNRVHVTAVKGSVGHTLGAAGLLDVVNAVLALNSQRIPPVNQLKTLDAQLAINAAIHHSVATKLSRVVVGNAGFGGLNAAVVVRGC